LNIEIKESYDGTFVFNNKFKDLLEQNNIKSFEDLWALSGETVKKKLVERGTERVILNSESEKIETYLKRYLPLPLKEYFKAITSFRPFFPSGALHEWDAIVAFHKQNIPTMIPIATGHDSNGKSALLTLAITDYTRASDLFKFWSSDPSKRNQRRQLIANIAKLAAIMHSAKFAHQDFYLVHLFVKDDMTVLPIDLQRIIMEKQFGRRWRVKDLGQLLFSSMEFTSLTDRLFFWKKYSETAGTELYKNRPLIKAIIKKAMTIYNRSQRKKKKGK